MTRCRGLVLAAVSCVALASEAGDYGLTVDDSLESCRSAATHTRNVCSSNVVVGDLRGHFVEGAAHGVAAVEVGFAHCSIWFAGVPERTRVYQALVGMAVQPKLHDETRLLKNIGCFPFAQMRQLIDAELALNSHAPEVLARLGSARGRVSERR
jgi:hypothetical protein